MFPIWLELKSSESNTALKGQVKTWREIFRGRELPLSVQLSVA